MAARTGLLTRIGDALFGKRSFADAGPFAWPRWREPDPRWNVWNGSASVLPNIIALSEHKWRSDGYFRNAVEAWKTALAGSGWGVAPRDPAMASAWNRYAANAQWGGGSFDALTGSMALAMVVSGEALAVFQPDGTLFQPPRNVIATDHSADLSGGVLIREGVEFTDGRESALFIRPEGATAPERVERARYVRLYRQDFPGQVHGLPWGASALAAADTLGETENALVQGVKVAAMFAGIATDENNTGAAFPFDGTGSGNVLESGLEPGTLKILPSGWRVSFATPQQAQQSAEFLRHQLHRISAGFGVPTHLLSNNLADANYSSLRAGLTEFAMRVEAAQFATIVPQFLKPAWEHFATRQYLAGDVASLPDALACDFIAPARPWIDPQKDVAATAEMLALGLTSRRRAAAELGWDINRLDQEIAQDREREKSLGLDFSENGNAA